MCNNLNGKIDVVDFLIYSLKEAVETLDEIASRLEPFLKLSLALDEHELKLRFHPPSNKRPNL